MNPATVMDQLGARLGTIDGLRVHDQPIGSVTPPAAVVLYPQKVDFDETYGRGSDAMACAVLVVVGRPYDAATKALLGQYCAGSGTKSVKAVLESGTYTEFDELRVESAEFDVVPVGGVDYMGALFMLHIIGDGETP